MDYCFHVRLCEQEKSPKTTCNSKFLIGIFSLAFLIGKSFRSRPFNLQDSRKMSIDQMRRIFFRELRSKGRREGITLRSTLLLPFLSFNRLLLVSVHSVNLYICFSLVCLFFAFLVVYLYNYILANSIVLGLRLFQIHLQYSHLDPMPL